MISYDTEKKPEKVNCKTDCLLAHRLNLMGLGQSCCPENEIFRNDALHRHEQTADYPLCKTGSA